MVAKIGFANPSSFRSPNTIGGKRFTTGTLPFQQPSPTFPDSFSIQPREEEEKSDADNYFDELERIRGAAGPALQAYQKGLTEQPTYDKYKPSTGRKLGAALVGFGAGLKSGPATGAGLGISVRDAPYNQARGDYEERMKGLAASAKLEQDEREASAKNLIAARNMGLEYKKYDASRTDADRTYGLSKRDTDIKEGQLGVSRYTAETGRGAAQSTAAYQRGLVGIGQTNARTGQANAVTNANEASSQNTYRQEQIAVARERLANELQIANIKGNGSKASPAEQQKAIDNALLQLRSDPRFVNFIEGEGTTDEPFNPIMNDGTSQYRAFMNELRKITNRQLEGGMPFGGEVEDFGVEIIPGGGQ